MPKYMIQYMAPPAMQEQMMNMPPEQAAEGMQAWMTWAGKAGDGVVDLGTPLGAVTTVGTVADGTAPAGYSILEADDEAGVQALLEGHPHLAWGGSIDVMEMLAIPGMG